MILIAVTGLAQSGKDTAARYISQKYGFKWLDFSRDALLGELKRRGQPATKGNMSVLGNELRKKYGADILAQRLIEKIKNSRAEKVVVSGVRSPEEALCLKRNAEKFFMVRLFADPKIRIKRSGSSEILIRDNRDIQNKGMSDVFKMADITIENNGTIEALYNKIDSIMRQF